MRRASRRAVLALSVIAISIHPRAAAPGQQEPSATGGWVERPSPGSSFARAYVTIRNPTTYDVEVQGASSDAAASIELRQAGQDAALTHATVPAYGVLEMEPDGVYLLLKDLKAPLAETVRLTIATDAGPALVVNAAVKRTPAASGPGRSAGGAIEGRVTFSGPPPPPTIVIQDGGSQQVLYVDRSGGLGYAVVFLPDAPPAGGPPPAARAAVNQRNFIFEPQVLAVRSGQTVRFTSDDPANHNVRVQDSSPANTFSIHTGSGSVGPHTHAFGPAPPGLALALSCDIHPWMAAWVYVFEHDRFAVTNTDGTFRIDGVPAGRHRLSVRQPAGGLARDLTVDVRAAETAIVDVAFTPGDLAPRAR